MVRCRGLRKQSGMPMAGAPSFERRTQPGRNAVQDRFRLGLTSRVRGFYVETGSGGACYAGTEMAARGRSTGGRPPKFDEPRRPVTVTLPERTLARLAAVDDDRATAIVKLVDSALPRSNGRSPIDVVEVAPGAAIILVGPSRSLRKIPWLKLAELS